MANILAVDDNLELCKLIRTTLERDGHRVETRQAGRDLTEALCRWADCILLDVMMPGEDGFAVCRRIRSLTEAPILFLSARTDEAAVLEGLGIGADDFLSKPFRVAELRARVAAHLRRQSRTPAHRMVRSGVAFDLTARSAAVEGKALPLTRSEYAICEYLALHAGQTFTKEQIYEAVFGIDGTADDTVFQHPFHLDRVALQTGCQMRRYRRLVHIRTHFLKRLPDSRHCFYLQGISWNQASIRTPLIAAHCRFIIRRIHAALPQFFHNQSCHIRFSNIRSRTCYKNPLAHLLSKSPSLNQRNHPFSYDGSHNTEHDIARNCQNKAI